MDHAVDQGDHASEAGGQAAWRDARAHQRRELLRGSEWRTQPTPIALARLGRNPARAIRHSSRPRFQLVIADHVGDDVAHPPALTEAGLVPLPQ